MKKCPRCGSSEFQVSVQVMQDWRVNGDGKLIACTDDCLEVVRYPTDNDTWDCCNCHYSAPGRMFEIGDAPEIQLSKLQYSISSESQLITLRSPDNETVASVVVGSGERYWEDEVLSSLYADDLAKVEKAAREMPIRIPKTLALPLLNSCCRKNSPPMTEKQAKQFAMKLVSRYGKLAPPCASIIHLIASDKLLVKNTSDVPEGAIKGGFFKTEEGAFFFCGDDIWIGFPLSSYPNNIFEEESR